MKGLLIVLVLLSFPGDTRAGGAKSSLDSLRTRARQMCEAWIADDLHATYALSTPDQRRCMTEEDWIKEWRSSGDGRIVSCKVGRIWRVDRTEFPKIHSKCSMDTLPVTDAANVKVKITLQFPDGSREVVEDMLNAWLFMDGVWYWHDYSAPSLN